MAAPCALFASCSDYKTTDFIKEVLQVSELPEPVTLCDNIKAYPWDIDTKYYTAKIQLCTTEIKTIGDKSFADSVQAFILHFDNNDVNGLKIVNSWLSYLQQLEVDIRLLVCNTATDSNVISRLAIQKWCIDNNFELVELIPEDGSDSEDDFAETTGIKRIIQALHAHTWINLQMKDNPDIRSPYIKQLMKEESQSKRNCSNTTESSVNIPNTDNSDHTDTSDDTDTSDHTTHSDNNSANTSDNNKPDILQASGDSTQNKPNDVQASEDNTQNKQKTNRKEPQKTREERIDSILTNEEQAILAAVGQENPEQESFEHLFEKLKVMKDKAETLPIDERKAYAEKVAVSFWKAIGGGEDEIDGLTDSDDEI